MPSPDVPTIIGRFEIVERIGRGAVGQVYLAKDPTLGRHVAIKTLSSLSGLPPAEQEEARARFLREARSAAALSHRNIVTVYDVGEQNEVPYIAMEYLEGTTLDRHTGRGHLLPPQKVLEIGIQAALALDTAHGAGIVHRDIKPSNLVLLRDGTLKVTDFGLAKEQQTALTSDQTLLGTPNYMSPEQVAGRPLDGRTDLFSLAVTLYELLAGVRPFPGGTVSSVLYRIVNEPPVSLSQAQPELPAPLERFLDRALAKDPEARPATGAEFARELAELLEQMGGLPRDLTLPPPSAPHAPPPSTANGSTEVERSAARKPPRRRRRGRLALVLLAGLVALVAVGWTLPLWAAWDPLGERRRPVEDWLSEHLGGVGRMVRLTAPVADVRVATEPPGLPVEIRSGPASWPEDGAATGNARQIVVPARLDEPVTLAVADPEGCWVGQATLAAGAPPESVTLEAERRQVELEVSSEPSGAAVKVDGQLVASVTPTTVELAACQAHTLELGKVGFTDAVVELAAGATSEAWREKVAAVRLPPPAEGRLSVPGASFPVGVYLAGRGRLGAAGNSWSLPPGRKTVTLVADEVFFRERVTVDVPTGGSVRLPVTYPALARLNVRTVPAGAAVTVEPLSRPAAKAREVGATPVNGLSLVAGDYAVRVVHPERGTVREEITIEAGETETVAIGQGGWPQ
jgi:serine/threonine-protein kinase